MTAFLLIIITFIFAFIIGKATSPPDEIITNKDGKAYLSRWHIIPKSKLGFNIYLHRMTSPDDARGGWHSHPWSFLTFVLWGRYYEAFPDIDGNIVFQKDRRRVVSWLGWRNREFIHRIVKIMPNPAFPAWGVWTLIITGRRKEDGWGHYIPTEDGTNHVRFIDHLAYEDYMKGRDNV